MKSGVETKMLVHFIDNRETYEAGYAYIQRSRAILLKSA